MPRVLQVFEPPDGGVAEHVCTLVEGLPAAGWEVEVAGPAAAPVYSRLSRTGVPLSRLAFGRSLRPRPYGRAAVQLRALVRGGQFDLVHLHSAKAGALGRLALAGLDLPILYTAHCFPFIGPQSARRRILSTIAERALARSAVRIICVCEDERQEALAARVGGPERLVVVHNGCAAPPADIEPDVELRAWKGEGPLAGCVTVLRRQKGVDVLIRAAGAVVDRLPHARFAIVGDGDLRPELEQLAAELGLEENLRFFSFHAPSARQLADLDLFVLPSRWEAFPIATLEALASGVPQVATDTGGTPEAVVDGETGRLVPPEDPAALAASIIDLFGAPEVRARMSECSRRRHSQRFTLDEMLEGIAGVYESALADHG